MTVVINPAPPSSGSTSSTYLVPTKMTANLTLSNDEQRLFRQHIIVGSFSIVLGTDSSLIGI